MIFFYALVIQICTDATYSAKCVKVEMNPSSQEVCEDRRLSVRHSDEGYTIFAVCTPRGDTHD